MTEIHLTKLIKHNDTWYKILRLIKDQTVMRKNNTVHMEALAAWRDYVGADKVLHDPRGFMLCERIEEVEWADCDNPDDDWDEDDGVMEDKDVEYNDDEYEY
jgi:hypothetical protein